ncbi:MAG: hypothetical protein WD048_09240 [Chitinophagales bacterium]
MYDFGYRFKKHLDPFAGSALKIYNSKYQNPENNQIGLDIAWNPLYREVSNGLLTETRVGVWGGLRF